MTNSTLGISRRVMDAIAITGVVCEGCGFLDVALLTMLGYRTTLGYRDLPSWVETVVWFLLFPSLFSVLMRLPFWLFVLAALMRQQRAIRRARVLLVGVLSLFIPWGVYMFYLSYLRQHLSSASSSVATHPTDHMANGSEGSS